MPSVHEQHINSDKSGLYLALFQLESERETDSRLHTLLGISKMTYKPSYITFHVFLNKLMVPSSVQKWLFK